MSATWWFEEAERRRPIDWKKFIETTGQILDAFAAGAAAAERVRVAWEAAQSSGSSPWVDDPEVAAAAATLGVRIDASADEVRAALRAKMATSWLHPDHGGDGVEASRLIAAQNLLVQRAKVGR